MLLAIGCAPKQEPITDSEVVRTIEGLFEALDAENKAEIELGAETTRAVLVVSGVTFWTSELAPYRVTVGQ